MINPVTELRKRLKQENLSQAALAKRLEVSEPYMSMILQGTRPPPDRVLQFLGLERITSITYRYKK